MPAERYKEWETEYEAHLQKGENTKLMTYNGVMKRQRSREERRGEELGVSREVLLPTP